MKSILLAASVALLASTAPAFAQDAATPGPDTAGTFTGPRAEIFGGWDRTRRRDTIDGVKDNASRSGITGGALLGYDVPIGDHFIVGPFASYAITSTKECASNIGCVKSDRQIEGGARAGFKFGDKLLAYGKGAYVNGQFRAHTLNDIGSADEQYVVTHRDRGGWRAGAGLQYALTRHTYVKAEYDYTKFKSFDAGEFGGTNATAIRFDRQEALGGFGVQF